MAAKITPTSLQAIRAYSCSDIFIKMPGTRSTRRRTLNKIASTFAICVVLTNRDMINQPAMNSVGSYFAAVGAYCVLKF